MNIANHFKTTFLSQNIDRWIDSKLLFIYEQTVHIKVSIKSISKGLTLSTASLVLILV